MKALAQPEMPTFKHDRIAKVQAAFGHARRKRALSREGSGAAVNADVPSEVEAEGLRRRDVRFDCETWHGIEGSSLTNEVQRRAKRVRCNAGLGCGALRLRIELPERLRQCP